MKQHFLLKKEKTRVAHGIEIKKVLLMYLTR